MSVFVRSFPLEDIHVRSEGDGRTVDAYAAVFGIAAEVRDQDGHYQEQIARTAFDRTIAQRGTKFGVFYNHGMSLYGTPSDRFAMPIGTPEEVRADSRGVFTRTRYHNTALADEVLESIRSGAITGQSFSGRFVTSDIKVPRAGFRPAADGTLTLVTRTEVAMREYGPTPLPNYESADIVGVRAVDLSRALRDMDPAERAELAALLDLPSARLDGLAGDGTPDGLAEESLAPAEHARTQYSEDTLKRVHKIMKGKIR